MDTVINEFNISREVQELFWIAGTEFNDESACFLRPVLRGVDTGEFHMCKQPIGMMPILTLGQYYREGKLLNLSHRGGPETCVIPDLGKYEVITSANIPSALYSFNHHTAGTQRLFKYQVDKLEIFIPATELIRYLFVHNRALANAMMRNSGLMALFRAVTPDVYQELQIDFTEEMPLKALSHRFVEEFSWIAVDPEARRAWDSILSLSLGHGYLLFEPPRLKQSRCEFRAVRDGHQILVLEILMMTGKKQPCKKLIYSHPAMKQTIKIKRFGGVDTDPADIDVDGSGDDTQKYDYEHKLENQGDGTTASQSPKILNNGLKRVSFDHKIEIKRLPNSDLREEDHRQKVASTESSKEVIKKIINVSAGDVSIFAELPPIEFKLLTTEIDAEIGDLAIVADVIANMALLVHDRKFSLSYCRLKPGKAFSTVNRDPRLAVVAIACSSTKPPICILDVDHSGGYALSLLAVTFKKQIDLMDVELTVQDVLNGLVDNNGHWDNTVEAAFESDCIFERFPKLISPREDTSHADKSLVRAIKLASRLKLLNER